MGKRIYADHAATTPIIPAALSAMQPFMQADFYNPSTKYSAARIARKTVEEARATIASCIGANPSEVYFTSGGTESDNWAVKGMAFRYPGQHGRIITSQIEHHAVLNSCAFLRRFGYDVVYLPVDRHGLIELESLKEAITSDTVLISIMTANNEIGTIEPIDQCVSIANNRHICFHTDAVQAVGHISIDVNKLGVDMLSASAHKFGGPKGIGFLFVRDGVIIEPLLSGGGQERGHRAGTENVSGIVGMAAALAEKCITMEMETAHLLGLRNAFSEALSHTRFKYRINGSSGVLPGIISLSINGAEGEMLLHRLDLMGIQVATGSACDSKETQLSHVLAALHLPEEYADGTIRISLGIDNTIEDVVVIAQALTHIIYD